jgi:hypothetical protein
MDSNFYNYISKELPEDDIEIWFRINNIIPEKMELFNDFCSALYEKIDNTYLGSDDCKETKIILTDQDEKNHFNWCWEKVISDFRRENITFNYKGEHYDYLYSFFIEAYYKQKDNLIKNSIKKFIKELFGVDSKYTKSDLDMLSSIYKSLDKNMLII